MLTFLQIPSATAIPQPSSSRASGRISRALAMMLAGFMVTSALAIVDSGSPATASTCLTENAPPGAGTEASPYQISTPDQLAWIGEKENFLSGTADARLEQRSACPERLTKHYVLTANIDLTGRVWSPIGQYVLVSDPGESTLGVSDDNSEAFSGVFDGAGFTIRGLSQLTTPSYSNTGPALPSSPTNHASAVGTRALPTYGLFGWVRGAGDPNDPGSSPAVIKNLTVEDAQLNFPDPYGGDGVGVLVGLAANAVLQNVHTSGEIDAVGENFGGLLGLSRSGPVRVISATSSVDVTGLEWTNPITSDITRANDVGGLIGQFDSVDSLVSDSFASGNVSGNARVGGLIGRDDAVDSVILRSGASGNVTGTGGGVGALVGEADSQYFYTFATGNARGLDEVGGLIGDMDTSTTEIRNSYARGNAVSTRPADENGFGDFRAGGLAGNISGTARLIANAYSTGVVSNSTSRTEQLGAFAGETSVRSLIAYSVADSFVDATQAGSLPAIALATPASEEGVVEIVSTASMKTIDTYLAAGWAIVDGWAPFNAPDTGIAVHGTHQVWGICPAVNDGYPYLLWQYDSNPCITGVGAGGGGTVAPQPEVELARTGFVPLWFLPTAAALLGLFGIGFLALRRKMSGVVS